MPKKKWYVQDKLSNRFVCTIGVEWETLVDNIEQASYWRTKKDAMYVAGACSMLFPEFHNIKVDLQVIWR